MRMILLVNSTIEDDSDEENKQNDINNITLVLRRRPLRSVKKPILYKHMFGVDDTTSTSQLFKSDNVFLGFFEQYDTLCQSISAIDKYSANTYASEDDTVKDIYTCACVVIVRKYSK